MNAALVDEIQDLYKMIWDQDIEERIKKHATYDGFRLLTELDKNGKLIGFVYGYTSTKGQFYRGLIEKALTTEEIEEWLEHCFEVVELVVHPLQRRAGLGEKLMQQLLQEGNYKTAILTTQTDNTPARHLYTKMGWEIIKEPFIPFGEKEYIIMGKRIVSVPV